MTHQLDLMPGQLVDPAVLDRIGEQLPKPREVTRRFLVDLVLEDHRRFDVGSELVLPERAREDHR